MAKKFRCTVCGYIHEGDSAPEQCPLCKASKDKFVEVEEKSEGLTFVTEHKLGDGKGSSEELWKGLNDHFMGECSEVGMYLAMSRQADREGYPEIAEAFKRYAFEEAEHAAKFAELIGEVVWDTKTNLYKRMNAESGACEDKMRLARMAKEQNLDAVHDTVHEMAKDEARHVSKASTTATSASSLPAYYMDGRTHLVCGCLLLYSCHWRVQRYIHDKKSAPKYRGLRAQGFISECRSKTNSPHCWRNDILSELSRRLRIRSRCAGGDTLSTAARLPSRLSAPAGRRILP